jgi:spore maturation protein CgeB
LRPWYEPFYPEYNHRFCSQTPYILPNEHYLPFGFDSEWHSPLIPPEDKLYDITIIGNIYHHRLAVMKKLEEYRTFYQLGLAKNDARLIYNRSIIGFNFSSMFDLTARVFEVSGLGIVPLCNIVPDLEKFFQDRVNCIYFSDENDAILKARMLISEPEFAKEIAKNARINMVQNKHSWDDRVQTLLEIMHFV